MAKTKYFNLDRDNLLGGNNSSDFIVPSQRAVKRYVDENSNKFLRYKGTTTTIISDYSTENPIVINGQSVTVVNGDCVIYSKKEFVWTDGAWHEFGDIKNYVGGVDIDIVEGTPLHNLPAPYIELAYVQNSSNTSVNTTIRPNADDVEIDLRYLCNTVGSNYIFQSRQTTSSSIFGISGSSNGGTILLGWNGSSVTSDVRRTIGHTYTIQGRFVGGNMTLVVLDETAGNSHTATGTYTFATPPTPFYLFGNAAGNYIDVGHYVYYACIKVNGVAVMEYIPCMNNSDAGFYDTVSETFIGATDGTLIGGPEASEQSTINFTNETGYVTTDRYHTSGSWSGLTYTATPQGGAGALSFTVPTGTSGTTVAPGNHTHSEYASSTHIHGNINNGGALTDTAAAASGNDYVVIRDASDAKIQTSTIKGVDVADAVSKKHSHSNITLSTTSQTYDGTHTIVLPSSDPYSSPRTPTSHSHGNITNGGAITSDVTIATGDKLVITDNSDSSKVARASISFDTSNTSAFLRKDGTWATPTSSGVQYGDVLMPTNPFGGKQLYINSIDNAFHAADQKYWVKITTHKKEIDGVTYPYIDSTKTMTDVDYFVDSPVVSTLSSANAFNGSYEDGPECPFGHYLKIHIQFAPFSDTWNPTTAASFSGYPYGTYYLSYYYTGTPSQLSQCRVYNKYQEHTIGWHLYTASAYAGSFANNYIEQVVDSNDYQRTCVEFIVYGRDSGNYKTKVTEIDYKLTRPNLSSNGSTVTKYGNQSLFYNFSWYKHNDDAQPTETVKINSSTGQITSVSLDSKSALSAVAIANGDSLIIADSSNGSKMTPTTITFDGSTATKYLSQKGTWENAPTDTNYYHSSGSWSNLTYTATNNGGTSCPTLSLTIPTGTSGTTVALGNHSHGNISNTGTLTDTVGAPANGDYIVIRGASGDAIKSSNISFDGSTTNQVLSKKGTWVSLPTDTNYYHSTGTWNGLTYTASNNGGTSCPALSLTIPTGTSATTVALGNHTHSNYASSTHTHSISVGSGTVNYTPAGSITNGTISVSGGTTASNLLTKSSTFTVTPTSATTTKLSASMSSNVVTSATKTNVHAASSQPSTTLSTAASGDVTVATGGTEGTAASSTHTHSVSASTSTAVSAYTSNTPTYKKATTTTQTAGTAASWATEQTLVSGTTDDYCLSFVFTANVPSSVAGTVATGEFESGTSSNGVLGSISFGTTDCASKGHTHTASSSASTPQTVITAVPTTCLVASTTTPTITLSKPSGTTASGDIEVIGSSSSGTVGITLSTGTTGSVDIPTNAISGVSVAPASNTTTESAVKTIGTFSQGTSTFSGTGVELVTSTPE